MINKIKKIISVFFTLAIFTFFSYALIASWGKILQYQMSINFIYLSAAFCLFTLVILLYGIIWRDILQKIDKKRLSIFQSFRIQIGSWLSRYIPGKAGLMLYKIYQGQKQGFKKRKIILSIYYESTLQIASAFLLVIPIALSYYIKLNSINVSYQYLVVLMIFSLLILTHPKIILFVFNMILKLVNKKTIHEKYFLNYSSTLKYIGEYALVHIINGIAFFLLINSVTLISIGNLFTIIGIFILSGFIGLLTIFIPSGLGAREGIIILLLSLFFPLEIATFIALLARLTTTLSDGLLGVLFLVIKNKR